MFEAEDKRVGDDAGTQRAPDVDELVSRPFVSVVVPMFNEAGFIEHCIETFDHQTYPHDRFEVLVVDGESDDGSRARVLELSESRAWLHLVANPDRRASAAFNRGIERSCGDVVCLVGAHAAVGPDFLDRSVEALATTGAAGVGGMLRHEGTNPVGQAIGLAMTSRFGMASPFRYSRIRQDVDTIGHPAYRREVLREVGPFDETLERNSDYEFNYRVRAAGHRLVFDPDIVTLYRPRSTLSGLARQFFHYGRGKAAVARTHPGTMEVRHLIAPLAVLALVAAPAMAQSRLGRVLVSTELLSYLGVVAAATVMARPDRNDADVATFVAAFPVMHLSWGAGFLLATLRPSR